MSVLYRCRVELRAQDARAPWRGLRDAYEVHRALWRAFPGVPEGDAAPFRFRADAVRAEDGEAVVRALVYSTAEPAWERLGEGVRVLETAPAMSAAALRESWSVGRVLRFYLRANATRAVKDAERGSEAAKAQRGKRVAVEGEEAQRAWLLARAEKHGFAVCTREVTVRDTEGTAREVRQEHELWLRGARLWRWRGAEAPHAGTHQGVDYEGLLEVRDTERFCEAVLRGVGPAKGLGFGLLSVRA